MDQDVTLDLVPDLTAEDLVEIGVSSIGHRRRLLTEAQAVRALSDLPPEEVPADVSPELGADVERSGAEQRMVTAMFCDLVGSTRLATLVDPEEYRDRIAEFRQLITETLGPYEGHIARFLGDGIVVFFGLARTQEHSAENAVAAALDIIHRIANTDAPEDEKAQVRIGIATGLTVVEAGDPDQGQIQTEDSIVGEIPNLAARLQSVADPNTIVVSQATRDRLGHLFHCEDHGVLTLKGIAGGVQAWRVTGHSESDSRFDAMRAQIPTTEFVGRITEMAQLATTAERASAGQGQVSLIMGDAGMGKSRLAREFLVKSGMEPSVPFLLQCTPYHTGTPFQPFRRLINRLLDKQGPEKAAQPEGQIRGFLQSLGLVADQDVRLLSDVLSSPTTAQPNEKHALDERYAQITMLAELFCAMAQNDGAIILEDLHWMDPSTSEVLSRVADRLNGLPIHVLCTMRPGAVPDWCLQADADVLTLDRLAATDFGELIRSVALANAPDVTLTDAQIAEIATRCDGSPVFAEELTRYSLDIEADEHGTTGAPLPATLADSLLSRLDRLEMGRELAQLAAVIGNEFPVEILTAVSDLPKAEVLRGVASLIEVGVLQRGHSTFGPAVGFRHMLLQDAAYLTLLRRDRVAQHARIAATLTRAFPEISAAMPQVVAHHLSRAGDLAHAVTFWDRAGTLAAGRSAYSEAIVHFRKAIEDNANASVGVDLEETELGVRLNLVAALIAAHGFNTPAVQAEMPRIEALGAALQSTDQMLPLLVSKWTFMGASGQFSAAIEVARQIKQLVGNGTDIEALLAYRCLGTANFFSGNLAAAQQDLVTFFELYDPAQHDAGLGRFGSSHHGAMSAVGLAELAVLACDDAGCDKWTAKAESLAKGSGQAHDLCHCTFFTGCVLPLFRGQLDVVSDMADHLRDLSRHFNLPIWASYADLFQGTVLMLQGRVEEGSALARPSIEKAQETGGFLHFCMVFHAEACLQAGLVKEARDSFSKIGQIEQEPQTWLSAEFGRVDAMIAYHEGKDLDEVLSILSRAENFARRQEAILFQRKITSFRASIAGETQP